MGFYIFSFFLSFIIFYTLFSFYLFLSSKGILDSKSYQSATEVAGGSSSSKGAATSAADLIGSEIDPGGGSSRSTFIAKREC
jgi:hypothetical protein